MTEIYAIHKNFVMYVFHIEKGVCVWALGPVDYLIGKTLEEIKVDHKVVEISPPDRSEL